MTLTHTGVPMIFELGVAGLAGRPRITVLSLKQPHFISGIGWECWDAGSGKLDHPAGVIQNLHGENVVSFQLTAEISPHRAAPFIVPGL